MARVSDLDEFLHLAYSAGVPDPGEYVVATEAKDIPLDLRQRLVARAGKASSEFLAEMIIEAARTNDWGPDELADEAIGYESEALQVLSGSGDPRDVSALGMARLFITVGLEPDEWEPLLIQATATFVTFPTSGSKVLGRTTRLSPEQRARALGGEVRDPARAQKVARNFVEEVTDAWTTLRSGPSRTTEDDL